STYANGNQLGVKNMIYRRICRQLVNEPEIVYPVLERDMEIRKLNRLTRHFFSPYRGSFLIRTICSTEEETSAHNLGNILSSRCRQCCAGEHQGVQITAHDYLKLKNCATCARSNQTILA